MKTSQAIRTSNQPTYISQFVEVPIENIGSGDVLIKNHYSSLNFKDALAITGKGKILKKYPLIPGIDACGEVLEPGTSPFKKSQLVLVTGCGLGETQDGGFSEYIRVPKNWVIPLPEGLTPKEAMTLGTAGFTAALCLWRMQQVDQTPDKGPIVITGASGGVGSLAIQIFHQNGFEVIAVSNKTDQHDQLKKWGATTVVTPGDLKLGTRPLESARFGGVIDNVGGELLSHLIAHTHLWGNVACVGLAGSPELHTTVMPMILRGVSLLGVSSANCPKDARQAIWTKLAHEWKPQWLEDSVRKIVNLQGVLSESEAMIAQKTYGRTLVKLMNSPT
ncbi:MAG: YhdH/YhfP family quinone oxidoreductase [Bdellovibrionales bacterium]|nr:YhdH/YhfP family quinone oxidoreductase [Bdellovibrionales bacterium]